ncbi:MAG: OmpA family protein [Proteobacteria bacterium]|nr:OmpA family protein [Pseudomonadota bacterium]
MSTPPAPKEEEVSEDWLVTYADAITILMAFFVMMFSIIKPTSPELIDALENSTAAGAIVSDIAGRNAAPPSPFQTLMQQMNAELQQQGVQTQEGQSSRRSQSFEFKAGEMFATGSATLLDAAIPILDRVAQNLMLLGIQSYKVDVEGHTDDDPISTQQFPSNWELSTARAAAVARFLISRGVEPDRITVVGYAETRPKVPNRDLDGNAIAENMTQNRRVVVRIER